ncbi:DNA polymerase III subunit alpha [Cryobacterium sp. TMT2-10]|uniref:DNA-directed DNA polymerase n=1 Tax=Cryobacterium shii TaxID=1259235 RepID=A0AAQ2HGQ2_9MICO|nr:MULTISPECIES: DNA polymerase III subunit alpha [Cryobacterium]TFC52169.1 DNA polymerase III subunit alpha [Cryobacterium shii]TFC84722.1 DNA polymerase III subunit alpha [Cryobacterium sp. TmT2-59]TFD14553.1 DNA polymerase III subunit alpha [Cryobacterium sp. TMT4-10]TFD19003.1 DNA polymerase III subunit alpha [Cryobacterium sp. TMT2-23]TFD39379.1 DNA polymerase III subunit alpha [Cryobacterium sp. TMT2-10]
MSFPHLHVASAYSTHYGVTLPEALAEQTAAQQSAAQAAAPSSSFLAVTDRDGLYGAVKHVRACAQAGIRPGLGADLAVHDDDLYPLGRVVVLAHGHTDGRGYAALCRAVSSAHAGSVHAGSAHGSAAFPSIARSRLAELAGLDSLTVLIGPASDVGLAIGLRDNDGARTRLAAWQRAMPPQSVACEVVCHLSEPGTPGSVTPATRMLALAEYAALPAVLTNAVRYGTPEEAVTADLADAARTLTPLARLDQPQTNGQAWLKPESGMRQVARMVVDAGLHDDDALERLFRDTWRLADQCSLDPDSDIGLGRPRMPEARIIGISGDPFAELWKRARAGVDDRYAGTALGEAAHARLAHEMKTVEHLGFAGYFLTVARVADIVREMGVRIQARGSGVGSVLNYALHTSSVEPIANGLLWERFLSPERQTLPDIDLDVESARRHDIYRTLFDTFGSDRVSLMSMTNAYRGRGAVRDAGLALGMDRDQVAAVAKQIWRFNARDLRRALEEKPELGPLAAEVRGSAQLDLLVDLTAKLDRLPRHISVHPCGVILSDLSLLDRTPVQTSGMGLPMSQFDKHDMDPMGLIKLDILGVRMQSAMAHAVEEHRRLSGESIDLDRIPLDDPATFELIRSTRTLGIFQIESPGQMELVGKLQPEVFNDLTVEISLFRPGPMQNNMPLKYLQARHGEVMPDYIHPRFEPILRETRGVVIFHEQVMRLFDELTGCGLGKADVFRRHLGKPDQLPRIEAYLREAALERGFDTPTIDRIWQVLAGFGSFGFAKAHGAAFALPTYQSAWLKTHHPAVFLAGLLTHAPGMWPKDLIVAEARLLGVPVLGLDVQRSTLIYRVEDLEHERRGIRLPLPELSGSTAAERGRIVRHQPFTSLQDFRDRVRPRRSTFEALARVGALDSFIGYDRTRRHELLAHIQSLRGTAVSIADDQLAFEVELPVLEYAGARFDAVTSLELRGRSQTDLELRDLALAVSGHQMARFYPLFSELGVTPASELINLPGGTEVLLAGVRRATNTPPMRGGRRVVFVSLDDGTGPVSNVVFFHDAQERIGGPVFHAGLMLVRGRTRRSGTKGVSVTGENLWDLTEVARTVRTRHAAEAAAQRVDRASELAAELAALSATNVHHLWPRLRA